MSDSTEAKETEEPAASRPRGSSRLVKRYGPIVAGVAVIGVAVGVLGGGDDGDSGTDGGGGAGAGSIDNEELIRSGPMTPAKADLLDENVDFGPYCDTETGKLKLPTVLAPPCVEPFDGDNGGATATGVTEDEILIVQYITDPALELTPETFRDGLFRMPPAGGGPTIPAVSWGDHDIWPEPDYGLSDDMTIVWWDPEAPGDDEIDNPGKGMYRYALGGRRYKLGEIPDSIEDAGVFDVERSVTVYDEQPPEDTPPDHEPPDLSD